MSRESGRHVLAIGLDAAESSLIRRMIAKGDLPTLARLLERGTWSRVASPNHVSASAVWPNFSTGRREWDHGHYSLWNWDPGQMGLAYTDTPRLTPFWKGLADDGMTIGVLDVPFSPFLGLPTGFEVHEWGAHCPVEGRLDASPPWVAERVRTGFPPHPFSDEMLEIPTAPEQLAGFLEESLRGLRLRGDLAQHLIRQVQPDLSLIVFEEAHHAGHFAWHTVEPDLPMYADLPPVAFPPRTLGDLYRELDRQVGRLVEAAGPGTSIFVFALHGMGPSRGIPDVVAPLLEELGIAQLAPEDRRRSLLAAAKRRLPEPIRGFYRRTVPLARRSQWGRSAVMSSYDWSRTQAFVLPLEQFGGLIRLNLAGREAQGIVPPEAYTDTCDRIEQALSEVTTVDGRPVVHDVLRPPRGAHAAGLPDLVVHWTSAAFECPALVRGRVTPAIWRDHTGQHTAEGFCIASGPGHVLAGETITREDLHRLFVAACALSTEPAL